MRRALAAQPDGAAPLQIPSYEGQSYEALVPNTLDLAERAELAINAIIGNTNPQQDYDAYFYTFLNRRPPRMLADGEAYRCQTKLMEALPLMRLMSGNRDRLEVDRRWADLIEPRIRSKIEGKPHHEQWGNDYLTGGRLLGLIAIYWPLRMTRAGGGSHMT